MVLGSLLFMPLAQAISLNGFTQFAAQYDLNARVAGVISQVHVSPGQRVRKGDILVELDATPQQARLKKARAIEQSLKPETEIAELELEKAFELYDRDSLSQVGLKNAENKLAKVQGEYVAAQAETEIAKYQLENTRLRSPIDGRVSKLHRGIAQFVNPRVDSQPIVTVVSSQQLIAVGLISSDQWKPSLIGRAAEVKFRDRSFHGKVSFLGYKRVKKSTGVAAYEIHVSFTTNQLIPEQMPVTIELPE
jgi:RND family efflux transporter MFP subunit